MKTITKKIIAALMIVMTVCLIAAPAFATDVAAVPEETSAVQNTEETENSVASSKAISAGIAIGLVAAAGAIAMGIAISKSSESISRQPEAAGSIRTSLMLGLVLSRQLSYMHLLLLFLLYSCFNLKQTVTDTRERTICYAITVEHKHSADTYPSSEFRSSVWNTVFPALQAGTQLHGKKNRRIPRNRRAYK